MISKSTIKLIKSLALKKFRNKENLFLVEGDKNVKEVLGSSYRVEKLFVTQEFADDNKNLVEQAIFWQEVEQKEIKKASLLQHPQNSLALCAIPRAGKLPEKLPDNLSVFLDEIQDPGNLGTIIRICDWFNIEYLFCSSNSADVYNPKVIQASMGSFSRVRISRCSFEEVFSLSRKSDIPVYGAFLNGQNIYRQELPRAAVLVVGNEGAGIRPEIDQQIDHKIKIPEMQNEFTGAESLNVSVATAIICSEFKRGNFL